MFGTKRGGMHTIQDSLPNVLMKHLSKIPFPKCLNGRQRLYSEKILPYIYGMKPLSLITGSKNVSCCVSCGLRGNWEFQLEQSYGSVSIGKNYFFKGKYICQLLKWGKGSNNVHITEGSGTSLHPCRESHAHQWWGEWMVLFNRDMKQGRRNSKTSRFWE